LVGINDHEASGQFDVTDAMVRTVTDVQREVAGRAGCAFFDVVALFDREPPARRASMFSGDKKHLSPAGRVRFGRDLYQGIISAYVRYRQRA
jgi:hypothetical protein